MKPLRSITALPTRHGLRVAREAPFTPGAALGKEVVLPVETITQTLGIVGQKGSGKTHFLTVVLEEILQNRLPVVVIDPMGVFYGVRSSVDGTQPGFGALILGGDFADVQITPGMGRAVAEWLVKARVPTILDVSIWKRELQCEFVADFAEELFVLNRGQDRGKALHIIVDEADIFAAQVPSGTAEKRSRDAIDEIVRRGRRRGLGMSMITQRPAVIAKDVLTQVSLLAILRIVGPQDREAVMKWLEDGDEFQRSIVKKSLGSLPVGTAWLWSPGWLQRLTKVAVRARTTFDSGRTPTVGEEPHGDLVMADVDASEAEDALSAAREEDAQNQKQSPKALRERITFLEEVLARHGIDTGPAAVEQKPKPRHVKKKRK